MMCSSGECFVVLPPFCIKNTVIFGRNTVNEKFSKAQEVIYYDSNTVSEGKSDGGAEPEVIGSLRVILQKPEPGVWGGDYGANEKNVCVGITWTTDEPNSGSGSLLSTDIVRFTLSSATNASNAVEQIGSLVAAYGMDKCKLGYVVCDPTEVYVVSCYGKLWAAQRLIDGFKYIPSDGLGTCTVAKSSENLGESLKELGLWDGEGEINFSACCGGASSDNNNLWPDNEPKGEGSFSLINMFATLRASPKQEFARSATISVLSSEGISCHWFTATPKPTESVFKPFVFAPSPKISPLTRVPADDTVTLLHKLHSQRKPNAVEDLKRLEISCVEEVNSYFEEHPTPNEELDELMKDCVEAEVKFYR